MDSRLAASITLVFSAGCGAGAGELDQVGSAATVVPPLLSVTLDSIAQVTSPAAGPAGTTTLVSTDFGVGQVGSAARFNGKVAVYPAISGTRQAIELDRGAIELWYQPSYAANEATENATALVVVGALDSVPSLSLTKSDALRLKLVTPSWQQFSTQAPWHAPLWTAGQWVKIRAEWDTASADALRIYVNGVRVDTTRSAGGFNLGTEAGIGNLYLGAGNASGGAPARGLIDEVKIFPLADGVAPTGAADAGTAPADTGVRVDSGVPVDTGVRVDSGVPVDTGVRVDSGVPVDTGVRVDSGVAIDAGFADSGVGPDAGTGVLRELTATPSTYRTVLTTLRAGDRLTLAAGTYTSGLPIANLNGTASAGVIITGPSSGTATFTGRSCCNTVSITNSSYLTIRALTLDGQGLAVDAVKAESTGTYAHHITLERLRIINHGADQQIVGINTKCPAWDWIVRENTIERAGTGMYFGGSSGEAPFVRGLIERNLVVDPLGYDIQIKHQEAWPTTLAGFPTADAVTTIRHNVLIKATNAATGDMARPNLLVGRAPLSGNGQNSRYEIYGNFLHQNATGVEPLFQGEGHVAFHDNVLVNQHGGGALFRNYMGAPKEIGFYHNTIYVTGTGVSISGVDTRYAQRVLANAIFAGTPISGGTPSLNVTGPTSSAATYVGVPSWSLGVMDFYPKVGQLDGTAPDLSPYAGQVDTNRDFNDALRTTPGRRGAYSGAGTNPGWRLTQSQKTLLPR